MRLNVEAGDPEKALGMLVDMKKKGELRGRAINLVC